MLLGNSRRNHLLCACKGHEENAHCSNPVDRHCYQISPGLVSISKKFYQRGSDGHDHRSSQHGAHHSCGYQNIPFMDIRSQPRHDSIQRDIDHRVRSTEQTVGHIGPDQFSAAPEVRDQKGHKCKYCKGHCP